MKPNWIKTAYEVPDTERHVVACTHGGIMFIGSFDALQECWWPVYAYNEDIPAYNVTHWCELPELPSEGA